MHKIGLCFAAGLSCALAASAAPAQEQAPAAASPIEQGPAATPPAAAPPLEPAQKPVEDAVQGLLRALPQAAEPLGPKTLAPQVTRYSFDRVNGAILRLDSVSGRLTVCSQSTAGWVCQAVPEDRAALEKEIGRLQTEVAELKNQVAALRTPPEPPRPPADLTPAPKGEPGATLKLPSHEDMERARAALGRAWRRLVDTINDLRRDMTKG